MDGRPSGFVAEGTSRLYRKIDFRRDKVGISAKVLAIEYDPNRSARIALLQYQDGEKRYILAPVGLQVERRSAIRSGGGDPHRECASVGQYASWYDHS